MNQLELRTLFEQATDYNLDNRAGPDPTPAQVTAQLNEAIAEMSLLIRPLAHFVVSYTAGEPTVDLAAQDPKALIVHRLGVNNNPLLNHRDQPGLMEPAQMVLDYPGYEAGGDEGVPVAATQVGETLYLYPKPEADLTIVAYADVAFSPLPVDDDAAVPDMPEELHPAIAYMAASMVSEPTLSVAQQAETVARYDARAARAITHYRQKYDAQRSVLDPEKAGATA